jgi:hypothetical protein
MTGWAAMPAARTRWSRRGRRRSWSARQPTPAERVTALEGNTTR